MSKKIAVGMLAACALAGIGARGEELNVAEGETVTLSESMSVDGGTVAGTLILSDGMTLTLARNVFDAKATLVLSNATVSGFSDTTEVTLANAVVAAAGTSNVFANVTDSFSHEGCNVTMSGALTGAGRLLVRSTGRGVTFTGDASSFTGTLAFDMSGNYFNGRLAADDLRLATVEVAGGLFPFNRTDAHYGRLVVAPGATFRCDRGWNDSNNLNLHGDSVLGGAFEGNEMDVNVHDGATVLFGWERTARVNVDAGAPTLSGGGTLGQLRTWGNPVNVANAPGATLTIERRADGDTGVLTIVGEAVKPSGHAVLAVGDPSRYSVAIASALAAEGWKLRETAGVYSLCRPGLCLLVR